MNAAIRNQYTAVIGLEVHVQLLTKSKMFACEAVVYGGLPNTYTSAVTLAHPGTLPQINKKAVEHAIKLGLACEARITHHNRFDRKNYFYPDLPKGYQITQQATPIGQQGHLVIRTPEGEEKSICIQRIQLEEDTGKSLHDLVPGQTLLDYNRAGTPLAELITAPDLRTSQEAYQFLTALRKLVRYLDICDGNMEEGSLRCDANVSVMRKDSSTWGQKVEVKNMNSIRNVQLAIEYEIERQIHARENGQTIHGETRSYDASTGTTVHRRRKEGAVDYHYLPEPDLSPVVIDEAWIAAVRATLPPLPQALLQKFVHHYQLSPYDAGVLVDDKGIALFFEALCQATPHYKAAANWVIGPVKAYLNTYKVPIAAFPLDTACMVELIELVQQGTLSFSTAAKQLFTPLLRSPRKRPSTLAKELGLLQEQNPSQLTAWIQATLEAHPQQVAAYKAGKKGLMGFFMGAVMRQSKGKAHPQQTQALLQQYLG